MTTNDNTTDLPSLDRAIIALQALEDLLHELPEDDPRATAMRVLAARATTALARVQFAGGDSVTSPPEEDRLPRLQQRLFSMGNAYGPAGRVKGHILNARDAIARGDRDEYDREADQAEAILNRPWGNA